MKHFLTILILFVALAAQAAFTVGVAGKGQSISAPTYEATNTSIFTYYGFPVTNYPGAGHSVTSYGLTGNRWQPIQVSFDVVGTTADVVICNLKYPENNGTWDMTYGEIYDGETRLKHTDFEGGNGPDNFWNLKLNFTTGGTHHVVLSWRGNFCGVVTTGTNTVTAHQINPKPNLLIVEGDSYTEGYSPAVLPVGKDYWFDGWVWQTARQNSPNYNTIVVPSGVGGTGFIASGLPYGSRVVSDICTLYTNLLNSGLYNKIFITASGTINDQGQDTNAYFMAVTNVYATIKNGCPQANIFVVGNWYANYGSIDANVLAADSLFARAAANLNLPYFSPVKARLLDPIGTGNYSLFMGNDSAHPTPYGYGLMAAWMNTKLVATYGTNWDASAGNGSGAAPRYLLTVNNGSGSGLYTNGQIVSVSASANTFDACFTNWSGQWIANANLTSTYVTMPAENLTVTANFAAVARTSSYNVTDFGAVGDAVRFSVNTASNSSIVTVNGTNVFSSADIGKVIEVFRTGPWTYYNNNPANGQVVYTNGGSGVFSTNQDTICLITNVTDGTNLWISIPQGWTTTTTCIVGSNNRTNFQNCIDAAQHAVSNGMTAVTINIPDGKYLIIGPIALDPNHIQGNIAEADIALTITSGGLTLVGQSTNAVLLGCGAGMEHPLWSNYNPSETWPYGRSGCYVPFRGILFQTLGPIAYSQYPLVFQNLTFDGGVVDGGLQAYNYWILKEGDGQGWDMTHGALLDRNPYPSTPQMHQLKVFTNCVFQHWRGEILKNVCGKGGTNTFIDIANCTFDDGNASADNLYFGQHIHGCTFNNLVKVMEYYQANADLPTLFEDNLWTNIVSNPLTIVGSITNRPMPAFTIRNNMMYGVTGNQVSFSPAENVTVISNSFYGGGCSGVVFTSAGLQPTDGTATTINNILIACNQFNNTGAPITMDGYPVMNVLVSNNVSANGTFASAGAGWKTNIIFTGNIGGNLDGRGIQAGSYFIELTNNQFGPILWDNGSYAATNSISYGAGRNHKILNPAAVFCLDDTKPGLIPNGAVLQVTNTASSSARVYGSQTLFNSMSSGPKQILAPGEGLSYSWSNGFWRRINPIVPPTPPQLSN